MARKTNRIKFQVFGKEMQAEQQYYLGNPDLPTAQSRYQWSDEMTQVYERCKNDIVFFAQQFFTIITAGKRVKIPLYDYQKVFLNNAMNHKRLISAFGRQSGKSTLMTIYALWLANFYSDQAIIICAHKGDIARVQFQRIKLAYKQLPGWLKDPVVEWNKSSMRLNNGSTITATNTTAEGPRGNSLSCLILDEFAFVAPEIAQQFWTSVTPTLVNNPQARMFVSSTPNGVGNMYHKLYMKAEQPGSGYIIQKVIWSDVPGRDEAWRKKTLEDCLGNQDVFAQEYECKFLGSSSSPFPQTTFDKIRGDLKDPICRQFDGYMKIWKLPQQNRVYSIGVDVSQGVGLDNSVIQVIDITDLNYIEQVACYKNDRIDPTAFTQIVQTVAKMYGNPTLCIERNGCGGGVCDRLYLDNAYPHFVCYGNDKNKFSRAGINSSQNTRGPAITNMKYWLSDNRRVLIRDIDFLNELGHFIRKKTGRWEAETTWHDDLIMSLVWALFPLHRDLVQQYFYVIAFQQNGKPKRVKNLFSYELDPNDSDLVSLKYAKHGRFGVMRHSRLSHRRFDSARFYQRQSYSGIPRHDPYKNVKSQYKTFDGDVSWMFES